MITRQEGVHYFILRKHIGDVMRQCKIFVLFKKYYPNVERIVVITTRLLSGIAKLYESVDDVYILSASEIADLAEYTRSPLLCHSNFHRDEYGLFGDAIGEQYKSTIFKCSGYNYVLNVPDVIQGKIGYVLKDIRCSEKSLKAASEYLSSIGYEADKTVVFTPYARSSSMVDIGKYEAIVSRLKEYGYKFLTNVSPKEKEIEGSVRMDESLDVFAALGVMGALFIGVQSGIIDVIRWLDTDIRLIDLHILKLPIDYKYAKNRNVREKVDLKQNVTHLMIENNEVENFDEIVQSQLSYYLKGDEQFEEYSSTRLDIDTLYDMSDYIVFVSAGGVTSDRGPQSYLLIFDSSDGLIFEKEGDDYSDIRYQSFFPDVRCISENELSRNLIDNRYYVISRARGTDGYSRSSIVINGYNYSMQKDGYNFVVFDKKRSYVVYNTCFELISEVRKQIEEMRNVL